jgi:nitrate reductase gamma subunit
MLTVQIVALAAVLIAILAMIIKALRYMTAPESMRWELYPVPHEKGRAEYGGSYLEELDWWTKPRHSDRLNELKEMAAEILLLKGVFHHNRRVWTSSFPFHLGMYLCIGWLVLLLVGAVVEIAGGTVGASAGWFGQTVNVLTVVSGYAGLVLAGLGALGLFVWRATDIKQRRYNAPIDYFNLVFFVAVTAVTLVAHLGGDPGFAVLRDFVRSTVTFSAAVIPAGLFTLELYLIAALIAWIPLTRMSHFVAKYFLYHDVRWNDTPNERGSKIEKRITSLLQEKVGWSAEHMHPGKTWGDAISEVKTDE